MAVKGFTTLGPDDSDANPSILVVVHASQDQERRPGLGLPVHDRAGVRQHHLRLLHAPVRH
jgi:hypothetical protein